MWRLMEEASREAGLWQSEAGNLSRVPQEEPRLEIFGHRLLIQRNLTRLEALDDTVGVV